jgi:Na+-driven multidrug efflux pump
MLGLVGLGLATIYRQTIIILSIQIAILVVHPIFRPDIVERKGSLKIWFETVHLGIPNMLESIKCAKWATDVDMWGHSFGHVSPNWTFEC